MFLCPQLAAVGNFKFCIHSGFSGTFRVAHANDVCVWNAAHTRSRESEFPDDSECVQTCHVDNSALCGFVFSVDLALLPGRLCFCFEAWSIFCRVILTVKTVLSQRSSMMAAFLDDLMPPS